MTYPASPRPRRRFNATSWGAAGAVGVVAALGLALAACSNGSAPGFGSATASPGAAALAASAPSMSTAKVPPPPRIAAVATVPATPAAPAAGASSAELATVRAQLEATLSKASSCKADTDCHTVAVGAKACGGPTEYRAFSATGADPASVAALAQRERDLAEIEARESHQVSACFMLGDPGAHCQKARCVTGPPGPN